MTSRLDQIVSSRWLTPSSITRQARLARGGAALEIRTPDLRITRTPSRVDSRSDQELWLHGRHPWTATGTLVDSSSHHEWRHARSSRAHQRRRGLSARPGEGLHSTRTRSRDRPRRRGVAADRHCSRTTRAACRCGLARPVRAEQGEDAAPRDLEVHAAQHLQLRVRLRQAVDADRGLLGCCGCHLASLLVLVARARLCRSRQGSGDRTGTRRPRCWDADACAGTIRCRGPR